MRIRRLDLLKFGPFTDHTLSFSEGDYGLHLVCGPNEAGKTSTLRALHQLLFGIPGETKCQDHFLHQHDKLRIGAELEDVAGNVLHVIRRKGGKATALRGADDRSKVAPEKLDQLLGKIDAARFSSQFGIDYEQLRAGGTGILEGGGDVGTSLFAAGAGQANFAAILKSLSDDCDKLFKKSGRNQDINSGVKQLDDARKAVRQAQLSETKWNESNKTLDGTKTRREKLQAKLLSVQAESGRLESFLKALPLIGELRNLQNELKPVADVRQLPDDFAEARRNAGTEADSAKRNAGRAQERIETFTCEITELHIVEGLLTNAAAIEERGTDLGRYRKLLTELPGMKARQEQCLENIRRHKSEIGLAEDSGSATDHSITIEVRQQIRDLSSQESGISQSVQSTTKQLRQVQKELEETTSKLDDTTTASDTGELKSAIERIQKQGDLEQQEKRAGEEIERGQQQLQIDLKKKLRWSGSIEEIEQIPVPSAATARTFEQEFADAAAKLEKLHNELNDSEKELTATESALQRISLGHNVPTEEDLHAARKLRDNAWGLAKQAIDSDVDKTAVSKFLTTHSSTESLADFFQQSVSQADEIADRLRREAEKVAEKSQLIAQQSALLQSIERCRDRIEAAVEQEQRLAERWQEAWKATAIAPRQPREMMEWLSDHEQLLKDATTLREDQLQQESLAKKIETCRLQLANLLQPVTEQNHGEKNLEVLLDLSSQVIADAANQVQTRSKLEENVTRLRKEMAIAQEDATEATDSQTKWQQSWSAATASLRSGEDVTPSQADKLLDAFDELSGLHRELEQLNADIVNSEAAISEFEQAAQQLQANTEITSNDNDASAIIAQLNAALSKARTNQSLRNDKQKQLEDAQQELRDAQMQQEQAEAILLGLCQEAGCKSVEDLPALEESSRRRQQLEDQLATLRSRLQELAGANSVDEFVRLVSADDAATIEPRLEQLKQEVAELETSRDSLSESIGSLTQELDSMDGSGDAAQAQDEVEQIRARLHSDAEEYVRLKLALTVLKNAVDRYRKQNQGPVLQKASELFRRLTLGAFTELVQEFDDAGKPVICGCRASDQSLVGVRGMSEGTCDQLYLALRLATLEVWLDQHKDNPIPFIVDDILIQFDDERAAAALEIFAELSQRTQVIMFTHHQHLVDVAQKTLADQEVLSVQTLERSVMTRAVGI